MTAPAAGAVVAVPFHDSTVLTVEVDGKPHVILKPAIEELGVDFKSQHRKLQSKSWASVVTMTMQLPGDTQRREHVVVDVRTFLMLLATIDENRVSGAARPLLVAYQAEVADAIEQYWTRGVAVNPRVSVEEAAKVIAIFAQAKVGDAGFWDAKARQLAGRVLGEKPEYSTTTRPLTVSTYLESLGLPQAEIRRVAGTFGKRVKASYAARYGAAPPTIEDLVGRHMVPVAQYQERHRDLFDEAWQQIQAGSQP